MKYEAMHNEAHQSAVKTKKRYLASALEREASELLQKIGPDDWDAEERRRAYEQEVRPYWERFGMASEQVPKQMWFELYGSRDHRMDPRFIPADLYYTEILPYMNNGMQHHGLMNKGYQDYLFSDVKRPETVAVKIEGVYLDAKRNIIREEDAIDLCRERGGVLLLKRSTGSKLGKGIFVFTPGECTEAEIWEIFEKAGASFIVQEQIRQHASLAALNPDSVCTVRVLSLFTNDSVYIPLVYLRVAAKGLSHVIVGNEYNAEILPDGHLYPKAWFDGGCWVDARKEGLYGDTTVIPGIDRILAEVKRIHPQVGHFKWIGWDFTLDQDGDPLLIELNSTPGDHAQRVCGRPLFGEMTDWLLEDYFINRSMEGFQIRNCWTGSKDIRRYRE